MYDAMVVQVGDSGESCSNEVGSVGLVVIAFAANAVKELPAKSKVSDEVNCEASVTF